jgi:outer membrane protein assembly factor BamB
MAESIRDYVYMCTGGLNAIGLTALDAGTGDVIWTFQDPLAKGVFGQPVFDRNGMMYIESFSSTAGSTVYALNPHTGVVVFQYAVDSTATVYYDTAIAIGKGMLYVGNDMECIAIGAKVSSGPSGGVIAAAVICSLLGVAGIVAAVWYFKFKRPSSYSSTSSPFSVGGTAYQQFGGAASSGAYTYNSGNI